MLKFVEPEAGVKLYVDLCRVDLELIKQYFYIIFAVILDIIIVETQVIIIVHKFLDFRPISRYISQTIQDSAIVTMEGE